MAANNYLLRWTGQPLEGSTSEAQPLAFGAGEDFTIQWVNPEGVDWSGWSLEFAIYSPGSGPISPFPLLTGAFSGRDAAYRVIRERTHDIGSYRQ